MSRLQLEVFLKRDDWNLQLDLDLQLEGATAIFGHSGAGKTTLLRILAGLEQVPGCRVGYAGQTWQDDDAGVWIPPHKRRLGYVFQESSLFEHLSVRGNLSYARKRARGTLDTDRALKQLGVGELMDRRIATLSGGEKQRVAIFRALLSYPQLILMDEPVVALDAASRESVLRCIQLCHREIGAPIVYVSHALDEVARLADRIVLVKDGRLVTVGPAAEVLLHPDILARPDEGLETLVEARVREIDARYGLVRLGFAGGDLWVTDGHLQEGQLVRVRIMARDLSLTLERQQGTSIQNIVAGRIVHIRAADSAQIIVELDAGGVHLLAQITRRSAVRLGLEPGLRVFAQIKSVALLS